MLKGCVVSSWTRRIQPIQEQFLQCKPRISGLCLSPHSPSFPGYRNGLLPTTANSSDQDKNTEELHRMVDSLFFLPEQAGLRLTIREVPGSENSTGPKDLNLPSVSPLPASDNNGSYSNTTTNNSSTSFTSSNTTLPWSSTTTHDNGSSNSAGIAVGVIIIILIVGLLCLAFYFYIRRKGRGPTVACLKPSRRTRRSSTSSSRRALDEQEAMDQVERPKPEGRSDDAFTIDDLDGPEEGPEGREEYYYDEVFGQSQFQDEATNNALQHLYSDGHPQPGEEMLDFDFETLGIRIEDYSPVLDRKQVK